MRGECQVAACLGPNYREPGVVALERSGNGVVRNHRVVLRADVERGYPEPIERVRCAALFVVRPGALEPEYRRDHVAVPVEDAADAARSFDADRSATALGVTRELSG